MISDPLTLGPARWRRYRPAHAPRSRPEAAIPLLNLALLLFAFLLLRAPYVRQPARQVVLPRAAFLDGAALDTPVVTVTQEGLVFFDDTLVSIETLGERLRPLALNRPDPALTIEADAAVPHGTLARLWNLASAAGFRRVYLANRPTFGDESLP